MRLPCTRRFRWLFVWKTVLLVIVISTFIHSIFWILELGNYQKWLLGLPHRLTLREIGLSKCPVCFGIDASLCHMLLGGQIAVKINSPWTKESTKGVSYGIWNSRKIVIKYLGTTAERIAFDRGICYQAGKEANCVVNQHVWESDLLVPMSSIQSAIHRYMDCASARFVDRVLTVYGKTDPNHLSEVEIVHLMTGLHLNPELLLLQVFPQEEGWPFPKYYGVCGRVMVVENAGPSLSSFLYKPWGVRAKLGIGLISLAHKLSLEPDDWSLYIGDALPENFAVSEGGEVRLVDLEHVVVVDLREAAAPNDLRNEDKCDINKPDCLSYSPSDMCVGGSRDHNYYAICRGVLRDFPTRRGLLHSPPTSIAAALQTLLDDCISGKTSDSRKDTVQRIENVLRES